MNEIRKEYKIYKPIIEETNTKAKSWVMHNVILLNERFDRSTLHRLNSSIQRFDQKFGPYRTKLPAISKVLDNAEKGLYVVLTGGASKKSAAHMLERMTLIYNILSNFFGRDLHMILKTPVLKVASDMADRALNTIEHPGHNHKMIKRVFASALKPDRVEREVFDRVYKNIPMPSLNWNEAANQLMGLCVNDLNELCGVEKVPAIIVDPEITNMNSPETLQEPEVMQEQIDPVELRPEFRLLQTSLNNIYRFAEDHRFSDAFKSSVMSLSDQLIELINDQGLLSRLARGAVSLGGLITRNDPVGRMLAQATRVSQTFNTIKSAWNSNKDLILNRARTTRRMNAADLTAVENILERALERSGTIPGIFGRLNIARVPDAPNLSPSDILKEFMDNVVRREIENITKYTITFEKGYATAGSAPSEMKVDIGSNITLPPKGDLDRVGRDNAGNTINYTFAGWGRAKSGDKVGDSGDVYTPERNTTLYAIWEKVNTNPNPSAPGPGPTAPPPPAPPPPAPVPTMPPPRIVREEALASKK